MIMREIMLNAVDGFMQCSGFKRNVGHFEKKNQEDSDGQETGKAQVKVVRYIWSKVNIF